MQTNNNNSYRGFGFYVNAFFENAKLDLGVFRIQSE